MLSEITLQKLAVVATASSFWKMDDIEVMVKQYFYPYRSRGKEEFLNRLIKEVIKKVDSESLPSVLYSEVLLAIKEMGLKMVNWFYYIRRRKVFRNMPRTELYEKFLKNVYFTYYGTIDDVRILKSWMNVPNVDLGILYVMACYYCLEELIEELWRRIVAENRSFYSYEHLCKREGFHLVAYWQKVRENDVETFFNDIIGSFTFYDSSQSLEVNMFRLSVDKGYVRAVKYFGNKMSKEEKEKNVKFCLTYVLELYYWKYDNEVYKRDQYTEISLYLANFLTDETKKIIFKDLKMRNIDEGSYSDTFSKMFISTWPWQECFTFVFNLLNDMMNKKQYGKFMSLISTTMSNNFSKFGIPADNSIFQKLLVEVWHSIPTKWKASVGKKLSLKDLFLCGSSSSEIILNDKSMVAKKNELIKKFLFDYSDNSKEARRENLLLEFINKVLISSKWSEDVRKTVMSLYNNIASGDFDLMNDLLKFATEEETKDFKEMIDHELICYYFIAKNEYESADRFLKWKFDNEKDLLKYKKTLYENKFTKRHICHLWRSSLPPENKRINSDKFLCWFLESDIDIIPFKIKHFANEMFQDFYGLSMFNFWRFVNRDDYKTLPHFLDWCGFNNDALLLVKNYAVKENVLASSMEDYMKTNARDEADKLFEWAFDGYEKRKKSFMRSFLISKSSSFHLDSDNNRSICLCKLYIGKHWHTDIFSPKPAREKVAEDFRKFINFFLRPYLENFDELKSVLKFWPEVSNECFGKVREDDTSTDECCSECGEDFEDSEFFMVCDEENCELFLKLLNEIESEK